MKNQEKFVLNIDNYYISQLDADSDIEELQRLCEDCSDYYELCEGRTTPPTAAEELFTDVPPSKKPEDKRILGIYERKDECKNLVGVIDMLIDFPKENTWYIGLLMIKPTTRNNKIGERVLHWAMEWAAKNGVKEINVGVLEENEKAFRFWSRMGFEVAKKIDNFEIGNKVTTVFAMRREV